MPYCYKKIEKPDLMKRLKEGRIKAKELYDKVSPEEKILIDQFRENTRIKMMSGW